jgi:anti-sigma28 factor (negative regulator of flagellin synthesis)
LVEENAMTINHIRPDMTGAPDPARERSGAAPAAPVAAARRAATGDRVEISDAARSRASEPDSLSAERLAELRERVRSGFYDSKAVLEHVAERLLADPEFNS